MDLGAVGLVDVVLGAAGLGVDLGAADSGAGWWSG